MSGPPGSGNLPALCEQSDNKSAPVGLSVAAISATGLIVPVSELTCWIATIAPSSKTLSSLTTSAFGAALNTASCSTALTIWRVALAQVSARAKASLAPLVKISSPCQPRLALIRARASSKADLALRPSAWGLEGLAQSAKPASIASRASGLSGLVAA